MLNKKKKIFIENNFSHNFSQLNFISRNKIIFTIKIEIILE